MTAAAIYPAGCSRGLKESNMTEDRVTRMQQRILKFLMEEIQGWVNDLAKGMLDPAKMMAFIRSMGIDLSKLSGVVGQQPGFDPYQVLGLDKSASDEEVKKRYKEIMSKVHPDKAGQEMTFLATVVNAAYKMIEMERRWQ
jgi:DnaJ-domain-containing protein 1